MRFTIILCLFSIYFSASSQTYSIKGRVINIEDSTALPGAIVQVVGSTNVATTNEKGEFVFQKLSKGIIKLQISFVGYEKNEVPVELYSAKEIPVIALKPSMFDLDETVITGTRTEKTLKSVPVLTQVITSRQINEMGITTIEQALEKNVPGLDFSHLKSLPNISMQGMESKYVLFLIDGERVAGDRQGNIDYFRLNTSNVERIEVVKGASSVLYGSQAMGGVINIITKKSSLPVEFSNNTKVSVFNDLYYSQLNQGMSLGITSGRTSSMSNLIINDIAGYNLNPVDVYNPTMESLRNISVNQKYDIKISDKVDLKLDGSFFSSVSSNAAEIHQGYHPKALGYSGGLKTNFLANKNNAFELSYHYDNYENDSVKPKLYTDVLYQRENLNNIKLLHYAKPFENHTLTSGTEFLYEYVFSQRVKGNSHTVTDYTLYSQDDWAINKNFELVGGLRLNLFKGTDLHITPKISALYVLSPLNFRLSVGTGYRAPSLKEQYMEYYHTASGNWWNIGNPNLKPESSKFISFSTELTSSAINIIANVYNNNIVDMIGDSLYFDAQSNKWLRPYVNIANASIMGLELMLKYKLLSVFSGSASYSMVNAKNNFTHMPLFGSTKNSGSFSFMYKYILQGYSATFNFTGKIAGQKFYIPETPMDPSFSLFNISIIQRFSSRYTLTIGSDNILNHIEKHSYSCITPGRTYFVQAIINLNQY